MHRTSPFPFLPDLETPMRDAMRGVANFAEATEDALEPAAKLLPEPLRAGFQRAIRSIETTGKQLIDRPLQLDQIGAAGDFVAGQAVDPAAVKAFAKVTCVAWEHLQQATKARRYMISETILASTAAQTPPDGAGADRAAALIGRVRRSSAIGRMPGIAEGIGAEDRGQIDLALAAVMIWLLAARADTLEEELALLELALALATAIHCDIAAAMDDPTAVSDLLRSAAAHL